MQGGPRPHLSVVRVPGKDRGLVTRQPIMAGQFVCEYGGEIIGEWVGDLIIGQFVFLQSSHWLIFLQMSSDWFIFVTPRS